MIRKSLGLLIGGILGFFGLGLLFFGGSLSSYVRTATSDLRVAVKGAVPIDFEIRRAETLVSEIEPQIQQARRQIAEAEVGLDGLARDATTIEESIVQRRERLRTGHTELASLAPDGGATVASPVPASMTTSSAVAPREQLEGHLARLLDRQRVDEQRLSQKRSLHAKQENLLTSAHEQLRVLEQEREALTVRLADLRVLRGTVEAQAAISNSASFDGGKLQDARAAMDAIEHRLQIDQRVLAGEAAESDEPTIERSPRDVRTELEVYLGEPQARRGTDSISLTPPNGPRVEE